MTFTMSFWLLVVIFTRLANFLVVEIDKLDLDASGFTTCCVVEMTWVNMSDSYKNFCWTRPTATFRCQQSSLTMFWGWWDHTFHVYQLCSLRGCACAVTHDVVRRRTQCECRLSHTGKVVCVHRAKAPWAMMCYKFAFYILAYLRAYLVQVRSRIRRSMCPLGC